MVGGGGKYLDNYYVVDPRDMLATGQVITLTDNTEYVTVVMVTLQLGRDVFKINT